MLFKPPRLGPGAIYLRTLDNLIRANGDLIKVAEIEPQIFWTKPTAPGARARGSAVERRRIAALPQRILTHGVGFPVGGTICDQAEHTAEFRVWNQELQSPWTSEHLSILTLPGTAGPQPCGFLMPPLQTDASAGLAADNIRGRAAELALPFAFETGVNYLLRRPCEMPDGEFFASVAVQADCGILLDLANLWSNEKNGRCTVAEVVAQLPLERVWEVHLAGLEVERGYWVDAHSRGIDPDLVALAGDVIASLPNLGAIIFELAPDRVASFDSLAYLQQMETLNRLWERAPTGPATVKDSASGTVVNTARPTAEATPESWEHTIAQQMLPASNRALTSTDTLPLTTDDAERFSLYKHLAGSFRTGALAELLGSSIRLLLIAMGKEGVSKLLARYIAATPPVSFPTDEALQFRRYMDAHPLGTPVPGFEEMLRFEAALIAAAADTTPVRATFTKSIDQMLADIAAGLLPGASSDCAATVLEIGVEPVPYIRVCEESTADCVGN